MPNQKILALALAALLLFYIGPRVRAGMALRLAPEPAPQPEGDSFDRRTTLTLLAEGALRTYTLHDYLCGLLCAELPADFPEEAWKAQAVAARSYALYKMEQEPPAGHLGADLCADHTCCAAFRAPDGVLAAWGAAARPLLDKAAAAADATDGILALYDGAVICAVWHSASAPYTAAAHQVWGGEVPYLQEAESPGGERSPRYRTETRIPAAECRQILLEALPGVGLGTDPAGWFSDPVRSRGGYLISLTVGGLPVRGAALRSWLGLPSAALTWKMEGEDLIFSATGTGHGAGMSQYGAAAMAEQGCGYGEILTHYYKGIKLLRKL